MSQQRGIDKVNTSVFKRGTTPTTYRDKTMPWSIPIDRRNAKKSNFLMFVRRGKLARILPMKKENRSS